MTEPVAVLRRAALVGQLPGVRLPHQAARRAAARHRRHASPHSAFLLLQGVETLPQRMDAHVANARGGRRVAGRRPARVATCAGRGSPTTPTTTARRRYLPLGPGRGVRVRVAGGRAAGAAVHRVACSSAATWPTSATPARSSCTPASTTHQQLTPDQLAAAGVPRRPRAHPRRARGPRGHPVGPRPGARRGREGGRDGRRRRARRGDPPRASGSRSCARHATVGDRRRVAQPGAGQQLRRHLPAVQLAVRGVVRQPERATEILGRPVYPSLADLPGGARPRRRVPPRGATCRPCSTRCSPVGRARSGSSSGSATRRWPSAPRRPG